MINTFSVFYYGFDVDGENNLIDFNEGGSELTAEVAVGSYTAEEFAVAVKTALDGAGALVYTVTFNRTTRLITIAASGTFSLLVSSGSHASNSAFGLLGFTGANRTGAATYTGNLVSGDMYEPQFKLQDYVSSEDLQQAVDATVNRTASGRVEVVKFGTEKFMECNIKFITDISQDGGVLKSNASGVTDARRFLRYLVTKGPIEFMPDIDDPTTFQMMILESTAENSTGVGYRLRELYDKNLPGYFETGRLKFRVLED